ncbi:MAG: hypothetical protein BWX83_00560 [Candidatus Cloacimonetes bacterium ADurb.Bin117]|jgi:hypothetical protein|nr:MAG: hypothetical protein BWX83_00560 [Candidatus Cloacimonetes bacterium ADurb.Bin117]
MKSFNLVNISINTQVTGSKINSKDPTYTSKNHKILGFPKHVVEKALKNAIRNREFEIKMYWNRAKYFWLFVSALWAAYGTLLYYWKYLEKPPSTNLYQYSTLLVLSCAGFILSIAWYFVNKGSKFWQENWEHQINFLENEIIGPSYKTILSKYEIPKRKVVNQKLLGSFPFSVSKINVFIAFSNVVLWLISVNVWFFLLLFQERVATVISGSCSVLKSLMNFSPLCLFIVFNAVVILALYYFSWISRSGFDGGRDSKRLFLGEILYYFQRRV